MTGLFSTVLNMSLIGSFTAAAVLLIRWFLKGRTPRWISYGAVGSGVDPSVGTGILFRTGEPVFPAAFPPCGYGWAQAGGFPGWNGV